MKNQNFTIAKIKNDKNGFTLVELIITIGILAIITMPLLHYFTDAGKKNAESRTRQNATVQAQDILENFKNSPYQLNDSAVVCAQDTDTTKWTVKVPADPLTGKTSYTLKKTVKIDRSNFDVEAEIEPIQQVTESATSSSVVVDYQRSLVGTMDTDKDVMISENGQSLLAAKLYFYGKHSDECAKTKSAPVMTMAEFEKYLDCTVVINASEEKDKWNHSTGNVVVKAEYQYRYAGSSYPAGIDATTVYKEVVETSSLDPKEMSNIYLFYQPVTGGAIVSTDKVQLNADTYFNDTNHVQNGQLKLFLIAQNSVSYNEGTVPEGYTKRKSGYKLDLTDISAGSYFKNKIGKIYTNLSFGDNELYATAFGSDQLAMNIAGTDYTLVDQEPMKRVAKITVRVLKGTKEYAVVKGTKIQN
ncbi:MAG: prepilin-type N-terminal cleavage/methylation domain-containing protein [Lachnospiraceae bacterium]|nr:prepilin-type N-terminal cleavage/methylation domain-containing protein [Lachnospiraceae bacterium]